MKLSEYIKKLQKLQRAERRKLNDPEVVCERFSDTELVGDSYPQLIRGKPSGAGDDGWIRKLEEGQSAHDEKTYVLVANGN